MIGSNMFGESMSSFVLILVPMHIGAARNMVPQISLQGVLHQAVK